MKSILSLKTGMQEDTIEINDKNAEFIACGVNI